MKSITPISVWTKLICFAIASCAIGGWTASMTRASAIVYSPTAVSASSQLPAAPGTYQALQSIDSSGLSFAVPSSINTVADLPTHDQNPARMWLTDNNAMPATITFDLGSAVSINRLYIWNSGEHNWSHRSAKDVEVYAVASMVSTTPISTVQAMQFAQAADALSTPFPAEEKVLSQTISSQFVQFRILSNYGADPIGGGSYVGLAEVRLGLVPEPATLGVMMGGSLLTLVRRRRASV